MSTRAIAFVAITLLGLVTAPLTADAGPETSVREFASGQIKKGVRSIGMGGDGATFGNYALVYRDGGGTILDYGLVHFSDTGNDFTFTAVGFTTPTFWDDAALYVIAMSQHASNVRVWSAIDPTPSKPPSTGDGSNQAVFVKLAKPLGKGFSAGVLLSYELSQMTLLPDGGAPAIDYRTAWRPSGGVGLSWTPAEWLLAGVRVLASHDQETRTVGVGEQRGHQKRAAPQLRVPRRRRRLPLDRRGLRRRRRRPRPPRWCRRYRIVQGRANARRRASDRKEAPVAAQRAR